MANNSQDVLYRALLDAEYADSQAKFAQVMEPNGLEDTSASFIPGSRLGSAFAPKAVSKNTWMKNSDKFLKDVNGEAKVFYHGTNADISAFTHGNAARAGKKYSNQGNTFFTSDPKFAADYAEGIGGNVIPVNLNAEKLFDYPASRTPGKVQLGQRGMTKEVTDALKAQGYTGTRGFRYPHEVSVFDNASIKSAFHPNKGYDNTSDLISKNQLGGTPTSFADNYDSLWR